jgi:hypothetical protein
MDPTQELIDDIYRDRVLRARNIPPPVRFFQGLHLFDTVCERMKAGIRHQHPDADEKRVDDILRAQLGRLRKIDEYAVYRPLEQSCDQ